jgi:TonB family protein
MKPLTWTCTYVTLAFLASTASFAAEEELLPVRDDTPPCMMSKWEKPDPEGIIPPALINALGEIDRYRPTASEQDAHIQTLQRLHGKQARFLIWRGTVTRKGTIKDIEILCSQPAGVDRAWMEKMAGHIRFKPALKRNKPVEFTNNLFFSPLVLPEIDTSTCQLKDPWYRRTPPPPPPYAGEPIQYPTDARRAGIEGNVMMSLDVTASGAIANPTIVCSSKPGVFEAAVLSAARTWKLHPLMVNGKPIDDDRRVIDIEFKLQGWWFW